VAATTGTLLFVVSGHTGVSSDDETGDGTGEDGEHAEEAPEEKLLEGLRAEMAEYPVNAGVVRALGALAGVFLGTTAAIAVGGFGDIESVAILQRIAVVTYSGHNIEFVVGEPGTLWFVNGEAAEYRNALEQVRAAQQTGESTDVPINLYYMLPVVVLTAIGMEFSNTHWDVDDWPHWLESVKFATTVAVPYAAVLVFLVPLLGGELTTGNILGPALVSTAMFGLFYPAVFVMIGALLVYAYKKQFR
jgi:hypothetical protein